MQRRDARAPDVAGPAHDYGSRVMSRRRISDSKIEGRLLYGSTPLQHPAIVNVRRMEWKSTTGRRSATRKSAASPSRDAVRWRLADLRGGWWMSSTGLSWVGVGVVGGRWRWRARAVEAMRTMRTMQVSDDGRCSGQCSKAMQAMGRELRVPDPRPVRAEMKK